MLFDSSNDNRSHSDATSLPHSNVSSDPITDMPHTHTRQSSSFVVVSRSAEYAITGRCLRVAMTEQLFGMIDYVIQNALIVWQTPRLALCRICLIDILRKVSIEN